MDLSFVDMYFIIEKFDMIMLNCEYYNLRELFFIVRRDELALLGEFIVDSRKGVWDEYFEVFNRRI